ncbi:MAG: hypothetical protein EA353_12785 [Puniceicoccaceae bacterium]|nr:MAG: hypothetical protein EA353_12785 [Puniceicoccaceae bacterium]
MVLVCLLASATVTQSQGQAQNQTVLLQHNFSGSPSTALSGVSLDVGEGEWAAGPGFFANGSVEQGVTNAAWLPFVPEAGKAYTLSARLTSSSSNPGLGFGFVQSIANLVGVSSRHAHLDTSGIAWILHRGDTINSPAAQHQAFYEGPSGNNRVDLQLALATVDVVITLDATDAENVWISLDLNDGAASVEPANVGPLAALAITGVGFSCENQEAIIKNFLLIETTSTQNGTLIMISSVSSWLLLCCAALYWRNIRKFSPAKTSAK